jgi:hypothetical protein
MLLPFLTQGDQVVPTARQWWASGSDVFCVRGERMEWQSLDVDGSWWMNFVDEEKKQG